MKRAVMTWLGLILQVVTIFFGLTVVVTYLSYTVMSGWVGVSEKAEITYCTYALYNMMSDTYVREGSDIEFLNTTFRDFFEKNVVMYSNYLSVLGGHPTSQFKYTPYGINLGSNYLVLNKYFTMTIVPQAKRDLLENRQRGRFFCKSYAFSPAGATGYVEVSYD